MTELSSEAVRLLQKTRLVDDPTEEQKARSRRRIFAKVGITMAAGVSAAGSASAGAAAGVASAGVASGSSVAGSAAIDASTAATVGGVGGVGGAGASSAPAAGALSALGATKASLLAPVAISVKTVLAYLAVGVGVGTAVVATVEETSEPGPLETTEAPKAPPIVEPYTAHPAPMGPSRLPTVASAGPERTEPAKRSRSGVTSARGLVAEAPDASPEKLPDIRQDLETLREANRAMKGGAPEKALEVLDRHDSGHRGGAMQQERRAARVLALCQARRVEEAREEARRFMRDFPASPLAERLQKSCAFSKSSKGADP